MSTRVYYGFKIAEGTSTREFLRQARSVILAKKYAKEAQAIAEMLVKVLDDKTLKNSTLTAFHPYLEAVNRVNAERETYRADHVFSNPNYCSIDLCYHPDGSVYGHLNTNQGKAYWEALQEVEGFEEYRYWDGTDGPDDVSADEWEARERTWDILYPYSPLEDRIYSNFEIDPIVASHKIGLIPRSSTHEIEPLLLDLLSTMQDTTARAKKIAGELYFAALPTIQSDDERARTHELILAQYYTIEKYMRETMPPAVVEHIAAYLVSYDNQYRLHSGDTLLAYEDTIHSQDEHDEFINTLTPLVSEWVRTFPEA